MKSRDVAGDNAEIAAVSERVNPNWATDVDDAIKWVATRQRELTTDDVWERLAQVSSQRTPEHRAMGPRMRTAQRNGWIEATYSTVISNRRRGAPVRVWRSNIYRARAHREVMS
jgi:hypothetical protein